MGCDIHAVFQAKKNGAWVDVKSTWGQERHYFLFAWLAGVRNGFGFAGVPTHTPIIPIAAPRGLPLDFQMHHDEHAGEWMGDHSFSWLTAEEILNTSPPELVWKTGVITREAFDTWDGVSQPSAWSGVVVGARVQVANTPAEVGPETTHVRVAWKLQDSPLAYFVDEVRRLRDEHGEVRVVFGFDN